MWAVLLALLTLGPLHKVVVGVGLGRGSGDRCAHTLGSLAALRRAVAEARRDRRPLVVVTAWQPPGGEYAYRTAPTPPLEHVWEQDAEASLDAAFNEALGGVPADVAVRKLVVRGPAADVLCAAADGPDDLLVIGGGPRSRWARLLHGAVRRRVLARTCCPVLVVTTPSEPRGTRRAFHHVDPDDIIHSSHRPGGSAPHPGSLLR
jgi:nucleotide-binding universal stress UspA family protein